MKEFVFFQTLLSNPFCHEKYYLGLIVWKELLKEGYAPTWGLVGGDRFEGLYRVMQGDGLTGKEHSYIFIILVFIL